MIDNISVRSHFPALDPLSHGGTAPVYFDNPGGTQIAAEAVAGLGPALRDYPVQVEIPDSLPEVEVDPVLIGQVLANLLDNASRHAPQGMPITVAALMHDDRVAVSVSDRGPGVPPAERDAVFDRFVRFDTGGRAGLGLTIAKAFVEAHGERIWVEDAPGGGARFVFTLPVAALDGHPPRPCVGPAASARPR